MESAIGTDGKPNFEGAFEAAYPDFDELDKEGR
jgi:hypothetical protein